VPFLLPKMVLLGHPWAHPLGQIRSMCYLGYRGHHLLMGLNLSLKSLVFPQVCHMVFQASRGGRFSQLLDTLLDPVLSLVGMGTQIPW
jgi:hypothetical protein